MTKALFKFFDHKFQSFEITGHAEYADEGLDIVCAGISATVITSLNLLEKLLKDLVKVTENQIKGYISLNLIDNAYNKLDKEKISFVNLIIENLIDSLQEIADNYPENLKIKIEK